MNDITFKSNSLRLASARAIVQVGSEETIKAIKEGRVPKGNVLEAARVAGLLGVKKTSDLIPDCHPLPIEFAQVNYEIKGLEIHISMSVKTVYKTGVEVEAMHGASIVALTIYDMLKPIDKNVIIREISLVDKTGGKSQFRQVPLSGLNCRVIVCSDSISSGKAEDRSGAMIVRKLKELGQQCEEAVIVPDEPSDIRNAVLAAHKDGCRLLVSSGGTGLSARDQTTEVMTELIDRPVPGIMEAARTYGQQRMPLAMLSRSVAGFYKDMLILSFPGSAKAVAEYMDALFPYVFHVFELKEGYRHNA